MRQLNPYLDGAIPAAVLLTRKCSLIESPHLVGHWMGESSSGGEPGGQFPAAAVGQHFDHRRRGCPTSADWPTRLVQHDILLEISPCVRMPEGSYENGLGRHSGLLQRRITAADILSAARTIDDGNEPPIPGSSLVNQVVAPALAEAENAFSNALAHISVAGLMAHALRRGTVAANSRR